MTAEKPAFNVLDRLLPYEFATEGAAPLTAPDQSVELTTEVAPDTTLEVVPKAPSGRMLSRFGLQIFQNGSDEELRLLDVQIPLQPTSIKIIEIISLFEDGLFHDDLLHTVNLLTNRPVSEQSLDSHLAVIKQTFDELGACIWVDEFESAKSRTRSRVTSKPRRFIKLERSRYTSDDLRTHYFDAFSGEWSDVVPDGELLEVLDTYEGNGEGRMLCSEIDNDVMYPGKGGSSQAAKFICSMCTVRDECLESALVAEEALVTENKYGIFGGLSAKERRQSTNYRNIYGQKIAAGYIEWIHQQTVKDTLSVYTGQTGGMGIALGSSEVETNLDEAV